MTSSDISKLKSYLKPYYTNTPTYGLVENSPAYYTERDILSKCLTIFDQFDYENWQHCLATVKKLFKLHVEKKIELSVKSSFFWEQALSIIQVSSEGRSYHVIDIYYELGNTPPCPYRTYEEPTKVDYSSRELISYFFPDSEKVVIGNLKKFGINAIINQTTDICQLELENSNKYSSKCIEWIVSTSTLREKLTELTQLDKVSKNKLNLGKAHFYALLGICELCLPTETEAFDPIERDLSAYISEANNNVTKLKVALGYLVAAHEALARETSTLNPNAVAAGASHNTGSAKGDQWIKEKYRTALAFVERTYAENYDSYLNYTEAAEEINGATIDYNLENPNQNNRIEIYSEEHLRRTILPRIGKKLGKTFPKK